MLLIGNCIGNPDGKWANQLLLLHAERFSLKSARKQILARRIIIAPDDISIHYGFFKMSSSPVRSHGISHKLDHKRAISTFHIDRPAVTSTLRCYYPGNEPPPALRLTCIRLSEPPWPLSADKGSTRPAAGLQAQ